MTDKQKANNENPLFWYRPRSDGGYEGPLHNDQIEDVRKASGAWVPLFAGADPVSAEPVAWLVMGMQSHDKFHDSIKAAEADVRGRFESYGAEDQTRLQPLYTAPVAAQAQPDDQIKLADILNAARNAGWTFERHTDGVVCMVPQIVGEAQSAQSNLLSLRHIERLRSLYAAQAPQKKIKAQAQPDLIRFDYVNADGQPDSKMITHDEMRERYAVCVRHAYGPRAQQPVSGADQFRDAAQMIEPSGNLDIVSVGMLTKAWEAGAFGHEFDLTAAKDTIHRAALAQQDAARNPAA